MIKSSVRIASSTGCDNLYINIWMPEEKPDIVIQLVHGMIEYTERYEEFAAFMCEHGIGVAGHDCLGHGKTAQSPSALGYFTDNDGEEAIVHDVYRVTNYIKKKYNNPKIIILGHSMGSFVVRRYLYKHYQSVSAAIIMGTGMYDKKDIYAGIFVSDMLRIVKGNFYRSPYLHSRVFGVNDRYFQGEESGSWLTADKEELHKYKSDPLCTFKFTVSAYSDFFRVLRDVCCTRIKPGRYSRLPVLLISGKKDPVGAFGAGVRKTAQRFKAEGVKDLTVILCDDMRHEVVHEINRTEAFNDILSWIKERF